MAWGGAIIPVGVEKMQGQICGHYSSHPQGIIYVKSGTLGQVSHQCKSLSYVV